MLTQTELKRVLHYDQLTGIFTWLCSFVRGKVRAGNAAGYTKDGYVVIKFCGRTYRAHRLAWFYMTGEWPADQIDHKNGVRNDNAWANLREADTSFNLQNQRRARSDNKRSRLLGVAPNGRGFRATIWVHGLRKYLGTYRTPEEAYAVYVAAKRELHPGCTI